MRVITVVWCLLIASIPLAAEPQPISPEITWRSLVLLKQELAAASTPEAKAKIAKQIVEVGTPLLSAAMAPSSAKSIAESRRSGKKLPDDQKDYVDFWLLRAVAAVKADNEQAGIQAAKVLQELGLAESKTRVEVDVIALLNTRSWLNAPEPAEKQKLVDALKKGDLKTAAAETDGLLQKYPQNAKLIDARNAIQKELEKATTPGTSGASAGLNSTLRQVVVVAGPEYRGELGGAPIIARMRVPGEGESDRSVIGTFYLEKNPGAQFVFTGENTSEGLIQIDRITQADRQIGRAVLRKTLIEGAIIWSGTVEAADGNRTPIEFRRARNRDVAVTGAPRGGSSQYSGFLGGASISVAAEFREEDRSVSGQFSDEDGQTFTFQGSNETEGVIQIRVYDNNDNEIGTAELQKEMTPEMIMWKGEMQSGERTLPFKFMRRR